MQGRGASTICVTMFRVLALALRRIAKGTAAALFCLSMSVCPLVFLVFWCMVKTRVNASHTRPGCVIL